MTLEHLVGLYFRLKGELLHILHSEPWHIARIDRLSDDLAKTEKHIAAFMPPDEQCDERLPH